MTEYHPIESEYQPLDTAKEREDLYRTLTDGRNVLASFMCDEKEKTAHRIRAVMALSEVIKKQLLFIRDEEKYDELKKKIDGLIKQYGKRNQVIK